MKVVPADVGPEGPIKKDQVRVVKRKAVQAGPRQSELTSSWELNLPHVPFTFEFDSQLPTESLLALPDEGRAETFAQGVRLQVPETTEEEPRYFAVSEIFAVRDPPELVVAPSLPCDLAHDTFVEFEGLTGRFPAGSLVTSEGNGARFAPRPDAVPFESPGTARMRVVLEANPHRGWGDSDVRSIWPGTITTDWVLVRVQRR
jgi:hypothetical protein